MPAHTASFSNLFSAPVWKIIADPEKGLIYVETRDGENRKVFFHAIDLNAKKILWTNQSILDPWWSNLKYAANGKLLLVTFSDPEMPEQRGISVVNGISGKLVWGKEDAQVMHTDSDGIIVSYGSEESAYSKLSWENGTVLREISVKELFGNFNKKQQNESLVAYPFHFEEENPFFSKIQQYIELIAAHKAVRMIEYLEKGDKVLISYYIYNGEKLANYMLVADENGNTLIHEQMRGELNGIGMDTFFTLKDQLIIVKNNNEVQAYAVK
ncbi:MAG: DUF4905 domain-containing protein [Cytophagales bacterium]|nr:DUF4905 domain-containing protein [Cytophaga sp.]